jgi:hypothetical protein
MALAQLRQARWCISHPAIMIAGLEVQLSGSQPWAQAPQRPTSFASLYTTNAPPPHPPRGPLPPPAAPPPRPAAAAAQLLSLRGFGAAAPRAPRGGGTSSSAADTAGWSRAEVATLPNALSMARLLSGPLLAAWVVQGRWELAAPALAVSAATDWLDGWLARRSGTGSVLGSYLDPLADKVLVGSVVAALGYTVGARPPRFATLFPAVSFLCARGAGGWAQG